jgi:hypothetical protein
MAWVQVIQFMKGRLAMPINTKNERYDQLADDLNAIALRCAKRPVVSHLSDDEILGYDESGVPTR